MHKKLTKAELEERKDRNIWYLRDLFNIGPTGMARVYLHCMRVTNSGKKLYRVYTLGCLPGKNYLEIVNISGVISHITGARWDLKADGIWTTEISLLLTELSRIVHPDHNGKSLISMSL